LLLATYLTPSIVCFSRETRQLLRITKKYKKMGDLQSYLETKGYEVFEPYHDNNLLIMVVGYKSKNPYVDFILFYVNAPFRICPMDFLVYGDEKGNIIKASHYGGIVF